MNNILLIALAAIVGLVICWRRFMRIIEKDYQASLKQWCVPQCVLRGNGYDIENHIDDHA